jgi:hypothetical protein
MLGENQGDVGTMGNRGPGVGGNQGYSWEPRVGLDQVGGNQG